MWWFHRPIAFQVSKNIFFLKWTRILNWLKAMCLSRKLYFMRLNEYDDFLLFFVTRGVSYEINTHTITTSLQLLLASLKKNKL